MGSVRKRQLAALAFVAVFGFILFLLGKTERTELYGTQGRSFEKARVLEVLEDNEQESGQYVGQQKVLLVLDSGSRKGETVEAVSSSSYLYGAHCRPGMRVIAAVNESGEELYVTVYSQDRSLVLYGIVALFLISVWAIGGRQGLNSAIEQLEYVAQMTDIKVGELLYAGILISALGAIMDVAMSVSSAVHEVAARAPELGFKELFRSGIHVGRDMMGTMSNTLILAFTGTSINTLIFIYAYGYSLNQTINMYSIGIEIIQGISATLGVIFTVPVAAYINALLLKKRKKKHERHILS